MTLRRIALPAALLAVAGYFAVFGGEYTLLDLWRIDERRQEQAAELEILRDSVAALRARVDSLEHDPRALERIAREKFGLIRPGERLYRFADDSARATAETAADSAATP